MSKKKLPQETGLGKEAIEILERLSTRPDLPIFKAGFESVDLAALRAEAELLYRNLIEAPGKTEWRHYVAEHPPGADVIAYLLALHEKQLTEDSRALASARGRRAGSALHDAPGGNRAKQAAIREAWSSGKYSSRDICAEQECAVLEMSFSTARKALRHTPDPA